jgi:hypothetical protein
VSNAKWYSDEKSDIPAQKTFRTIFKGSKIITIFKGKEIGETVNTAIYQSSVMYYVYIIKNCKNH